MPLEAPAKLTLTLHVTGVRPDGYHEIDATMVTVSHPHDILSFEAADHLSLAIDGPFAAGVPADATNLVWRAAAACGASLSIRLTKGIPAGAGLGGGSADAAALLVALGADQGIGATLGADVPFCMRGGAARVRGIGDVIDPVEAHRSFVVVATPNFGCATAAVYRAWDDLGGPHDAVNDLEPAAQHVEPRLVAFKRTVEDAAGAPAILAGSGSSYAVVFADGDDARAARDRVGGAIDGSVWLGRSFDERAG